MHENLNDTDYRYGAGDGIRRKRRKPMIKKNSVRLWVNDCEVHPMNYKVSRRGEIKCVLPLPRGRMLVVCTYTGAIGQTRYRPWTTKDAQRIARRRK